MSRFEILFQKMNNQSRPAAIPFLMLGYPDLELSLASIRAVIASGADALELGIPFSDPIADGAAIQQASMQALAQGITPTDCFKLITQIRQENPDLPIGLLVYANLVYHQGIENFYSAAAAVGIDAVLIPDVPTEESKPFVLAAQKYHIDPVLLATLSCNDYDLATLSQVTSGYTYVVTRNGVTGTDRKSEFDTARSIVNKLKFCNAPPPVFGFGICNAEDVMRAYAAGAKGVIIGSALIQEISSMSPNEIREGVKIGTLMDNMFNVA